MKLGNRGGGLGSNLVGQAWIWVWSSVKKITTLSLGLGSPLSKVGLWAGLVHTGGAEQPASTTLSLGLV